MPDDRCPGMAQLVPAGPFIVMDQEEVILRRKRKNRGGWESPLCLVNESCLVPVSFFFFLNKFIYFIYLFLAELGLLCCTRAFSSCGEQGLLFVAVHGLLLVVASLVAERGL